MPVEVGFVDLPGEARAVAVSGDYAYAACVYLPGGTWSLLVIDVNVPSAPVEVGSIYIHNSWPNAVAVAGAYAYLATPTPAVVDVSDRSTVEVGFYDTAGASDVAWRAATRTWRTARPPSVIDVSNRRRRSRSGSSTRRVRLRCRGGGDYAYVVVMAFM